jgi:hypothetical protein
MRGIDSRRRNSTNDSFDVKSNRLEFNQTPGRLFSYPSVFGSKVMGSKREDIEAFRLLRAFFKIQDPAKRREILELVEKAADEQSR